MVYPRERSAERWLSNCTASRGWTASAARMVRLEWAACAVLMPRCDVGFRRPRAIKICGSLHLQHVAEQLIHSSRRRGFCHACLCLERLESVIHACLA